MYGGFGGGYGGPGGLGGPGGYGGGMGSPFYLRTAWSWGTCLTLNRQWLGGRDVGYLASGGCPTPWYTPFSFTAEPVDGDW